MNSILDVMNRIRGVERIAVKPRIRKNFHPNRHIKTDELKQIIAKIIMEKGYITNEQLYKTAKIGVSTAAKKLAELYHNGELSRVIVASKKGTGQNVFHYTVPGVELPQEVTQTGPSVAKGRNFEEILQYVSDHDGERYSVYAMGLDLNIPSGTIYQDVYALQKRGLLTKDFNYGDKRHKETTEVRDVTPSMNRVVDAAITLGQEIEKETTEEEQQTVEEGFEKPYGPAKEYTMTDTVDGLVWVFIKETGSLSVVAFLNWLSKGENHG